LASNRCNKVNCVGRERIWANDSTSLRDGARQAHARQDWQLRPHWCKAPRDGSLESGSEAPRRRRASFGHCCSKQTCVRPLRTRLLSPETRLPQVTVPFTNNTNLSAKIQRAQPVTEPQTAGPLLHHASYGPFGPTSFPGSTKRPRRAGTWDVEGVSNSRL
jgi:hypothetical protein